MENPSVDNASDMHELVETLSRILEVPVELTTQSLLGLARSAYFGTNFDDPDSAIMNPQRRVGATSENPSSLEPIRIPRVEEIGLPTAWVVPLVGQDESVRYLWLLDVNERLKQGDIDYAKTVGTAIIRNLGANLDANETFLLGQTDNFPMLVTGSTQNRQNLLEELVADQSFRHDDAFFALAVAVHGEDNRASPQQRDWELNALIRRVRDQYPAERTIVGKSEGSYAILYAPYANEDKTARAEELSVVLRDGLYRAFESSGTVRWIVGVSATICTFRSAGDAIRQALGATHIGSRLGWASRTVYWERLGHFRTLSALPENVLESDLVSEPLRRFLTDDVHRELVDTLTSFLDNNGSVKAVAAELYLHRASVYHRLRRIEQLLHVDLANGTDRLELHLSVMAWRLLQSANEGSR